MTKQTSKITVHVSFDYKGQTHKPNATLDLDAFMQAHKAIPDLHAYLANKHHIDAYSYEYEMLLGEPLIFSEAQGDATQFMINNKQFELTGFTQHWHAQQALGQLQTEIQAVLTSNETSREQALEKALLAAYQLGKST